MITRFERLDGHRRKRVNIFMYEKVIRIIFLSTRFPFYLLSFKPAFLSTCFPIYLLSHVPASPSTCFPIYLLSLLPAFPSTCLPLNLLSCKPLSYPLDLFPSLSFRRGISRLRRLTSDVSGFRRSSRRFTTRFKESNPPSRNPAPTRSSTQQPSHPYDKSTEINR